MEQEERWRRRRRERERLDGGGVAEEGRSRRGARSTMVVETRAKACEVRRAGQTYGGGRVGSESAAVEWNGTA